MEPHPGFGRNRKDLVCRLHKSLYGLKHALRQWNIKLTDALVSTGFVQSKFDYSMFTNKRGDEMVIILVYIDDLMMQVIAKTH